MKQIKPLLIFLMLLATASCQTIKLPADLTLPELDEQNIESTATSLLIQHYRWLEWANESRYLVGEITKKQRDKRLAEIMDILKKMNAVQ